MIPARLRLHAGQRGRGRGAAAGAARRRPADVGGDGAPGAQAARAASVLFDAGDDPLVRDRRADGGRRHDDRDGRSATAIRSTLLAAARRDAAAAVHHRPARRARPLPDRLRRRAGLGGGADGRAALHRRAARPARPTRGVELARVELVVGLDTFQPVTVDDPRDHLIHSERYRVPAEVLARCARGATGRRRRHDQRARARERGDDRERRRAGPDCSSTGRTTGRSSTC